MSDAQDVEQPFEIAGMDADLLVLKVHLGTHVQKVIGTLREISDAIYAEVGDDETTGELDFVVAWVAALQVASDESETSPDRLINLIRRLYPKAVGILNAYSADPSPST